MIVDDSVRAFIGDGADATLITLNPDGSPQASLVWVALQSTPDGDELVSAHLSDTYRKVRNIRRDPRVVATIAGRRGPQDPVTPYLTITGTARIVAGGAPELLTALNAVMAPENIGKFPPPDSPPGFLTRIRIDKIGGVGVQV
ncbi:MAG: TIGR03618 family F420-dependent PPOX class oxidoreductase [Mycobacterium sp.]|nr:TIGR03618 family F420-dependent PPOX class oxidoreductase [Mycobacterium sp.]